jgi:glutamine cyclotransferase
MCFLGLVAFSCQVLLSSCAIRPEIDGSSTLSRVIRGTREDRGESTIADAIPLYTYEIVNTYPHDRNAFTQGLAFEDGFLYEGTGLTGQSTLRKVALETGAIVKIHELPSQFFGEGVTIYRDTLIQLTLRSRVGFVYHKDRFEVLKEFNYSTQGWGIACDGERLVMSDGTSILRFLDPRTFQQIDQIDVRDADGPLVRLNELEYVGGEIYANVWKTDRIARIAPNTGRVLGWIDLENLLGPQDHNHQVGRLNGIAYDAKRNRLFVTGKLWPTVFEIRLILR